MPATMRSIKDFKGSAMAWVQPRALERQYELRSGQELFATLTWVKVFGSLAEVQTSDGRFTLKRGGFLRPYVTIRDTAMENDLAILKIGMFRHGTLEFTNGKRISLVSGRFWGFEWEFVDENGQKLCSMRMKTQMMKYSAEVTLFEPLRKDSDLMVMLLVGWYTMVLMSEEAAATAVASTSATRM